MAHSCIHCQKYILVQPRVHREAFWVDVLKVDLRSVIVAAFDGCDFFNWCLLQHPEASNPIGLQELKDRVVLRVSIWAGVRSSSSTGQKVLLRWTTEPAVAGDYVETYLRSLYTMAEVGEPAARYNIARYTCKSVGSAASFELARTWLDECDKTHPFCKSASQDKLPLRVVEIHWGEAQHEPTVRLTNTTGQSPYAALTYCWGNSSYTEAIKLTNQTRQDWLNEIPFSRLPKTLQDGIITTWKLGLRFLWVDCLCIAQDDDTEKATEIAKMPQIYRGADITISAARSKSSDEGFLHDIRVPSFNASIFRMAYACPNGRLGTILLFDDPIPQLQEPIDSRGWNLQEYLLSPRLLIYGVHGMRFSCGEGIQYDKEEASGEAASTGNNEKLALLREVPDDVEMARETWSQILIEYSRRTLSHPGDRLPAISGIANYYSEILSDKYLAGIWRRDLPAALMWENISEKLPRSMSNQAPSWSWAAIDSQVENFKQSVPVDPHLSVVSHAIHLVEPTAPFGAVLSGSLTLKGLLKKALWDGSVLFPLRSPDTGYLASTAADAIESEFSHSTTGFIEVWCLQICPFDESMHRGPSGLILAANNGQTFRRLGIFTFEDYLVDSEERDAIFYSQFNLEQREWSLLCEVQEVVII